MKKELEKTDIINMICGLDFSRYHEDADGETVVDILEDHGFGYYTGGFSDDWKWNKYSSVWDKYTERELSRLYSILKDVENKHLSRFKFKE